MLHEHADSCGMSMLTQSSDQIQPLMMMMIMSRGHFFNEPHRDTYK
jgi:hypothetical protein